MKKILPLLVIVCALCSCSQTAQSPVLTGFSQSAVVESGDFSYNADIRFENNVVYITATSTNASGLTVSCDGSRVNYSYKNMSNDIELTKTTDYNISKALYRVFTDLHNAQVKKENDTTLFLGKTELGSYELIVDKQQNPVSLSIPEVAIYIKFN